MDFITRTQLRGYSGQLNERTLIKKSASWDDAQVCVFLSHSHYDIELIEDAKRILNSEGAEIYVDLEDAKMPRIISLKTAKLIKDNITANDKFVVLVTENSLSSVWVPWELGFADNEKGLRNIAIFPIQEDYGDFPGAEYFRLYSQIKYDERLDMWFVILPGPEQVLLSTWLGWPRL